MTTILRQGRCERSCPATMDWRSSASSESASLCANTRTVAPLARAPVTMDEWFSESEMSKQPLPTKAGMPSELVAKPMLKTMAAGLPTKSATVRSSSRCSDVYPPSAKLVHMDAGYAAAAAITDGLHVSCQSSAKPR